MTFVSESIVYGSCQKKNTIVSYICMYIYYITYGMTNTLTILNWKKITRIRWWCVRDIITLYITFKAIVTCVYTVLYLIIKFLYIHEQFYFFMFLLSTAIKSHLTDLYIVRTVTLYNQPALYNEGGSQIEIMLIWIFLSTRLQNCQEL